MKKNSRAKIIVILIIFILLIILGILGFLLYNVYNNYIAQNDYKQLSSSVALTEETNTTNKLPKNPIDFKSLKKRNSEIFAWIRIPDTNIDYPVLQSKKSDDFYLHRDINGEYKYAGSIYIEYCNSTELDDRVTVMYGHNMQNGSMFANLHKFEDFSFFKKHRYFYVYTPTRKLTYEVVSAHNYDSKHIMNSYNFAENKVFKNYLEFIQNPRSIVRNVREKLNHKLTVDDRILTLSTCLNSGDGRYLLQGVLVKDEFTR
ncbi:MAG: class B sortase [Ruminococcus sp.]|nr:class B sortase [Ruminococcus sp.]